ncbi:amidohydrolase [Paenibacillus antibioticophila]|uniref:Amidohydrolase n=1 Tax=Paenibacillus antibioticophila TaxID=1274374 RepID=A0A920CJ82_9BACL|nr:amidohydrolase [Paenibacillus antibioticophila]
MSAGTLYINGKWTRLIDDEALNAADAVYVEEGRIKAIGRKEDLKLQLAGRHVRTVDWEGAVVLPGLCDAHMHLSMHGMKLDMLDFSSVSSKEEMLLLLRERAASTPPGEWILGLNWNENNFTPAEAPTLEELNAVSERHPIFLTRTCFHAFLANTVAFHRAGIATDTPDPESGAFGRDESGQLNGWVYEEASAAFTRVQPEPDYAVKKEAIRRAWLDALRLGLTAAHTEDLRFLGSIETMLQICHELREEEGIAFRTHQLIYYPFLAEAQERGLRAGAGDEWLRIGAVKLFADGAIGGRTALLQAPYSDAPQTRGMAIHSEEGIAAMVREARRQGFPIAVHAIGDGAADLTLRAMEQLPLAQDSRLPDRLIHAQVLDAGLVRRMAALPLAADIQPRFVASDFPWVLDRVGPQRTEYLYAWKKLSAAGIVCAGGSDAPIEPLNPLLGMHAAVTRRMPEESHEGYLPEEKLTTAEALALFTSGSAFAAGEACERGTIEVGKFADFTVLDRELEGDPQQLLDAQVRMTIVNGKIGYQA